MIQYTLNFMYPLRYPVTQLAPWAKIFKQLNEIEAFKVKIDELLAEGYNPILDDGVGKNIAPLQKKKMIPYEVLNPGQLKKYLNADW